MKYLSKTLLFVSILINVGLVGVVYKEEKHSHVIQRSLAKHGIISGYDDDKQSPDYWARVGWTNTIEKLHTEFDIAFFGNSITRGSDFQLAFPDKKIINLGYSGDKISGMLKRISMIQKSKAKKVFIMAGTNDLAHMDINEYKDRYTELISAIQDSIPGIKIVIESVLPTNPNVVGEGKYAPNSKVQEANKVAESIAKELNCRYIDLYSLYADKNNELPRNLTIDGVHLYPNSYDRWAEKIRCLVYE